MRTLTPRRDRFATTTEPVHSRGVYRKQTPSRTDGVTGMDIDVHDEYDHLGHAYDAFEQVLAIPREVLFYVNEAVSRWSSAQHLHHVLIANGMMLKGVRLICRGHRQVLGEGSLNRAGRYVMAHGMLRGKAQAPAIVVPPENDSIARDELAKSLVRSRATYNATADLLPAIPEAQGYLSHFYLGELDAAQWLRLARLHSEHHLSIIQDITAQPVA